LVNRLGGIWMIIVSGAGSGLAKVVIPELSRKHEIIAISRSQKYEGKNIISINLKDYSEIRDVIGEIDASEISWINFAAHSNNSLLVNLPEEKFLQDFDVNFRLNFEATQILLPKMIASKFGRFIFISSSRALKGDIGTFSYSCGKRASGVLQEQIVKEYSRFGITANTLSLGFYDTNLWNNLKESVKKRLLQNTPTGKLSDSTCIAPTIELLIQHPTINNNVIKLDDGFQ
jgi:NAD(P)-dependent dehydrogenase (short-subunit alcohol dehydrogenase family)